MQLGLKGAPLYVCTEIFQVYAIHIVLSVGKLNSFI